MKKFRTNLETEIVEYTIIKETKTTITFENIFYSWPTNKNEIHIQIENKISSWHSWHDTFEEAKNYLIKMHNQEIQELNKQIEFVNNKIKIVKSYENYY